MIIDSYFSYIPNLTHQDGILFVQEYEKKRPEVPQKYHRPDNDSVTYLIYQVILVEAAGVEPASGNLPLQLLHT